MLSHLTPLRDLGLVVSPNDNVAVAKHALEAGTRIELPSTLDSDADADARVNSRAADLSLRGAVARGDCFALCDIPMGSRVLHYGQPIGTSQGIVAGDPLTPKHVSIDVSKIRDVDEHQSVPAPTWLAAAERPVFQGYRRPDGRVGTRNWVLVVPTSMCASHEATQIAMRAEMTLWNEQRFGNVDGVVAIPHNKGCGCPEGDDVETVLRSLAAYVDHPNVGGVVVLHLGCEKTNRSQLARFLERSGGLSWKKPNVWIGIQESGGTREAIARGLAAVESMLPEVDRARRSDCDASDLILGVESDGGDGLSGLSANPALGNAADRLIACGGATILSNMPDLRGVEHLLAARAKDAETARAFHTLVDWFQDHEARFGATFAQNPGSASLAIGSMNSTSKSLGVLAKGGTTRVEGTLAYAERIGGRGLHLMQGPGYDQESVPGLIGSGANVVVFTTARGSTIGNAIVPVIKLASNSDVFQRMPGDLDLSAGGIVDGVETVEQVGERLFQHLVRVAGKQVLAKAEETMHREFQIWAPQPLSL